MRSLPAALDNPSRTADERLLERAPGPLLAPARRQDERTALHKIALIGNHSPRRCGIATFSADLNDALSAEFPGLQSFVVAMNEPGARHAYPPGVRFEVAQEDPHAYRRAADFLNTQAVEAVSLQHEYGIFGGPAGGHLMLLLRELRMPVVTTLHTILAEPSPAQRVVMDELVRRSERLVVMSRHGAELLGQVHGARPEAIDVIPHGIHRLDVVPREVLGIGRERVILTFGLLSPDKGIEYVIDAMPAILAAFPDARYVVLGATHPHVKSRQGEAYRTLLEERARALGVDSRVTFHDEFVTRRELAAFLTAADVYVTPYLKPEQISSGTLAYALGSGKAVVSTPYSHARELLADGRGKLVAYRDGGAIAGAILELFADDAGRLAMCRRAELYGRDMAWSAVARTYARSLEEARRTHVRRPREVSPVRRVSVASRTLPAVKLDHLRRMTDGTGMLQHAVFGVPRYSAGYCLDDNARALIVTSLLVQAGSGQRDLLDQLGSRYLAFVRHAWNPQLSRFRNFLSYPRQWLEEQGSEDSHGRAVWALGTCVGRASQPGNESLAGDLFHASLAAVGSFTSPRAWTFALLGIDEYLQAFRGDRRVEGLRRVLAERLFGLYQSASDEHWPWFEERLTYCSARLPQALVASGAAMEHEEMLEAGLHSLRWLVTSQCSKEGHFTPVGSNGFHRKGAPRARFDQQPIEAWSTLSACLTALRQTKDQSWMSHAQLAFDWYLGANHLGEPLYDASTGGCRDGLHEFRMNHNQGAESTLSFLLSLLEMKAAAEELAAHQGLGSWQPASANEAWS